MRTLYRGLTPEISAGRPAPELSGGGLGPPARRPEGPFPPQSPQGVALAPAQIAHLGDRPSGDVICGEGGAHVGIDGAAPAEPGDGAVEPQRPPEVREAEVHGL